MLKNIFIIMLLEMYKYTRIIIQHWEYSQYFVITVKGAYSLKII